MKTTTTFFKRVARKFTTLFMVPAIALFTLSCSDDDDEKVDPNVINNLPGTVSLTADQVANTATLQFSAGTDWTASYANTESEWFTFTPENGKAGEITITLSAPYNDGAAKSGKLTIKHGTNTYSVTINQVAGKPDVATWDATNKEGFLQTVFAPDPYNATEENPVSYTLKINSKKDYTTLDEAPFDMLAFYANSEGEPTDSLVHWINISIAENSPVASEGKLLQVTIDTIDVNITDSRKNTENRYAYVCFVPKGTDKASMFSNGVMKDEFKAMGTSTEQTNYKISHDLSLPMLSYTDMAGQEPEYTSLTATISGNCKFKVAKFSDDQSDLNWCYCNIDGQKITYGYDLEKVRNGLTMGGQASAMYMLQIDRGENLKPIQCKHTTPFSIMYMKVRP